MICSSCVENKHKKCIKRNSTKDYADCDCQHRVRAKVANGDSKES